MDILKMDKIMFLSFVNMKLRDEFLDDKDLCAYYDISIYDFNNKLKEFSLYYDNINKQVKAK